MPRDRIPRLLWLAIFWLVFVWSAIDPHDRLTWLLEVLPALIGIAVLAATDRRFPLTSLVSWLILGHGVILMVGGHYTYAEVPLFDRLATMLDLKRNYYDKVGHLAQGLVPALIAREILIRRSPLRPGRWLFFIVVSICLAISACYELIEWWVALAAGTDAEAFLGTQGDVWDTQSDMACALTGALVGLVLLGRLHDRALARLRASGVRGFD